MAAIAYLVFPTGATALAQTTELFEVNLRYAVPALTFGLLLAVIAVALRAPRRLPWIASAFLAVAVAAQLEPNLWLAQPARHLGFLLGTAALSAAVSLLLRLRRLTRRPWWVISAPVTVGVLAVGFVAQHHYFDERYRLGEGDSPGLGAIYAWAQTVSHTRIALRAPSSNIPCTG